MKKHKLLSIFENPAEIPLEIILELVFFPR